MLRFYCAMMIVTAIGLSSVGDFNDLNAPEGISAIMLGSAVWPLTVIEILENIE